MMMSSVSPGSVDANAASATAGEPATNSAKRLASLLAADEPVTSTVMLRRTAEYTVHLGDGLIGILSANGLRKPLDEGASLLVRVIVGRADGTCDVASEEALQASN